MVAGIIHIRTVDRTGSYGLYTPTKPETAEERQSVYDNKSNNHYSYTYNYSYSRYCNIF